MAEKFEYTREWTNAEAFPLLGFTKSWENPEDYPTIELDETQVRKDMQSLHDEVKNYINDKLIPAVLAEDATEAARAAAEAQRETNETQRIENENARIAAEQSRITAEQSRASAETARDAAEQARVAAEQARDTAESARSSAEQERAAAESARNTAEQAREAAEQERDEAETSRVNAELNRMRDHKSWSDDEASRKTAEQARVAAEEARDTAESARSSAEQERAAAESARNTAEQARADETAGIVAQATEQAVIASNAASEASSSASGASTSASAAAASASSASDSASASASSATAAQASADEALSSKNSAKSEADRAKSEADRAAEIAGGDFVKSTEKGVANGVATLGADGKVPESQLPEISKADIPITSTPDDDVTIWIDPDEDDQTESFYTKAETNTLLQNKAPAGYGLGTTPRLITDWNDVKVGGWFWSYAGADNAPDPTLFCFGTAYNQGNPEVFVQEVWGLANVNEYYHWIRLVYPGTGNGTPWEWVDPPMIIGVEYRTTERYMGKPVYVKVVDCGAMPASTNKSVEHGIENISAIISCTGYFTTGNDPVSLPYARGTTTNVGSIWASKTSIVVWVDNSTYTNCNAYGIIKYTKVTD